MKLFYASGACSLAAHIVLEEIGIPFETHRVDFAVKEQQSPHYLKLNPQGRVPVLVDGDFVLTETVAILTYLGQVFPQANLLPATGSKEMARVLEWAALVTTSLHTCFAQIWRPNRYTNDTSAHPAIADKGRETAQKLFAQIDAKIPENDWLVGGQYTVADPYLGAAYRWGHRIGLDMATLYPRLNAWAKGLATRPAVQRALAREGITLFDLPS